MKATDTNNDFTIPFVGTKSVTKSNWGLEFVESGCKFTACQVYGSDENVEWLNEPWVATKPVIIVIGTPKTEIKFQANTSHLTGWSLVFHTKCTDDNQVEMTSNPYTVTLEADPCLTDLVPKAGYEYLADGPIPWRNTNTFKTIDHGSSLKNTDMFSNSANCPIDTCTIMGGWKPATAAVEASEGVEAKEATEATTCDAAAPANYKLVAGEKSTDGS